MISVEQYILNSRETRIFRFIYNFYVSHAKSGIYDDSRRTRTEEYKLLVYNRETLGLIRRIV